MCKREFGDDYRVGTNFELLAFANNAGAAEDWDLPIFGRRPGVFAITAENALTFQTTPVTLVNAFDAKAVQNIFADYHTTEIQASSQIGGNFCIPSSDPRSPFDNDQPFLEMDVNYSIEYQYDYFYV